jgi:hypothetical protein
MTWKDGSIGGVGKKQPDQPEGANECIAELKRISEVIESRKGKRTFMKHFKETIEKEKIGSMGTRLLLMMDEIVKREDNVDKGVKLIYNAIHRKPYPLQKVRKELFRCQIHGDLCNKDCPNYIESKRILDDRTKLPPIITDGDISTIADSKGIQPPAKSKKVYYVE